MEYQDEELAESEEHKTHYPQTILLLNISQNENIHVVTAVVDRESDHKVLTLDNLPLQGGGWLGFQLEDGLFLLGWNCVEMNRGSERVSGQGVVEGVVGEAVPVERGCGGICVGQTR